MKYIQRVCLFVFTFVNTFDKIIYVFYTDNLVTLLMYMFSCNEIGFKLNRGKGKKPNVFVVNGTYLIELVFSVFCT